MTHTVAAIAVVAGFLGQLSSATGGLGTISLVCILFLVAAVYMHLKWEKDTVGAPRFLMSQFISNTKQTLETLKTNSYLIKLKAFTSNRRGSRTTFLKNSD